MCQTRHLAISFKIGAFAPFSWFKVVSRLSRPATARMAARLSSVVRCVYCRETAALSCPTISRAIKSETPAAFSIVTALWRKL